MKALRKLAAKLAVSPEYLETGDEVRGDERRELELADAELELRLGGDEAAAERRLRALLDEALAAADVQNALRARIALGTAAAESGRPAEAVEILEAAVGTGVLPTSRPEVFAQLGRAHAALGDVRAAVDLYGRCLQEVEESEPDNVPARLNFATQLADALSDAGELDRAQSVLQGVLESADVLEEPVSQARLYGSLARAAAQRGHSTAALASARRAVALLEAADTRAQLGRARMLHGVILLAGERLEEAGAEFERAQRLLGTQANPGTLAALRTEQARRDARLGDGAGAVAHARAALELLGDGDSAERGRASQALAEGLALDGDLEGALAAFERAVVALEEAQRFPEAAQACRAWGRVLRDAGREGDALDVLDRAAELAGRRESMRVSSDG